MTLYNDELSQLRNGLISQLDPPFRFHIGDRVALRLSARTALGGYVVFRARRDRVLYYRVRWDVGQCSWAQEQVLEPEMHP